jgi:hypothetical protein
MLIDATSDAVKVFNHRLSSGVAVTPLESIHNAAMMLNDAAEFADNPRKVLPQIVKYIPERLDELDNQGIAERLVELLVECAVLRRKLLLLARSLLHAVDQHMEVPDYLFRRLRCDHRHEFTLEDFADLKKFPDRPDGCFITLDANIERKPIDERRQRELTNKRTSTVPGLYDSERLQDTNGFTQ